MLLMILSRWREIVIILALAFAALLKTQTLNLTEKLEFKTEQYKIVTQELLKSSEEVAVFRKAAEDSLKEGREAEIKRLQVIASMSNQINNMRKQEPPKECQKTIDWAVQNKGDLAWPVK